jgi:hypothetical protein
MEKKVYILFGDEACNILDNLGFESLIDILKEMTEIEYDEFEYGIFEFNEYEKPSTILLLSAQYGNGYNFLSAEEYKRIMNINITDSHSTNL